MSLKVKQTYSPDKYNKDPLTGRYFYYTHPTLGDKKFPTKRSINSQLSLFARNQQPVKKNYVIKD